MDEFGLIAKYLKPLAKAAGAFELADDVASVAVPAGQELLLTKDAIIAGVHFLAGDPLDLVARKLIRVNVSDLAAKGAQPLGYLLACCWPRATSEAHIALFARGLAEDQAVYGISLLGGDTTVGDGPLMLSLTALGIVGRGKMVHRSGARPGDKVLVTGTIGDAGLGLKIAKGERLDASEDDAAFLAGRYRLPEPRLGFGLAAAGLMMASIDVSDGLIADAGHIAEGSGVALHIEAAKLPLSLAAQRWIRNGGDIGFLATCGDDYEICFTAAAASMARLEAIAVKTGTQITEVGEVRAGAGAHLWDTEREISPPHSGYSHF
jgi:thiamine-monophosphate kinase